MKMQSLWHLGWFWILLMMSGCSETPTAETPDVVPPDSFVDQDGQWDRSPDGATAKDNQLIGKFFKKHPNLLGSPEWTGSPIKYSVGGVQKTRFYWFIGRPECPTWNAIEVSGGRFRAFSGQGYPGNAKRINSNQ